MEVRQMIGNPKVGMRVVIDDKNGSNVSVGDVCEIVAINIYDCAPDVEQAFSVEDKKGKVWHFMPSMVTQKSIQKNNR